MPLTFDILSDIQAFIIPTCHDDTVRWAAVTAGHFLMLNAGEFTVLSRDFFDLSIHLTCSDTRLHSSLLHGVSLPPTYKILNGSATTGFDPLYCSFATLRLCWLRYAKEPRSSPSLWYLLRGYYALV